MITHEVMGGLGNQLYQIFTTIALAMRTGQACVFHRKAEYNRASNTVRSMHWDTMLSALEPYLRDTDPRECRDEFAEGGVYLYPEPGHPYTPIELPPTPAQTQAQALYILEGYFQSYKYFEHEFDTICTFLKLEEQQARAIDRCRGAVTLQPLVDAYDARRSKAGQGTGQAGQGTGQAGQGTGATTVAMHFRFGDYKTVSYNHPLMTAAYYDRAMAEVLESVGDANVGLNVCVYLFYNTGDEDDVRPILAQLKAKYGPQGVKFHCLPPTIFKDRLTDPEHLLIMSACSHFILANSTYSLWASYFADYFNRQAEARAEEEVVQAVQAFGAHAQVWYPSVWFGPSLAADKPVHDMFPKVKGWTTVDAT